MKKALILLITISIFLSACSNNKKMNSDTKLTVKEKNEILIEQYIANGNNFFKQKKYEEAAVEFQKAINEDPQNDFIYNLLANSYFAMGNEEKAIETFKKAIECEKKHAGRKFSTKVQRKFFICSKDGKKQFFECPAKSIFWMLLQCCVDAQKFPCFRNCIP